MWSVIVAAGSGRRFGRPKQYEVLGGRRVLDWSVETAVAATDGVILVVPPGQLPGPPGEVPTDVVTVVEGGATRSASVRAGLAAVPDGVEVVVVHDAARPLASGDLFAAVVAAVRGGADGAVPGLPLTDTIKRVADSVVVATLDRDELVAVQTPQAFRLPVLRAAHAGGGEATDDAALVEAAGGRVVVVPGEPANRKVTTPVDLAELQERLG